MPAQILSLKIGWRVQGYVEGECIMNIGVTAKESLTGAGWFNLLLGMWLVVSPFVLGFERSSAAMWSNIAMGAAVMLITWLGGSGERPIQWVAVPVAAWLFFSPFVLGFAGKVFFANNIIMAFVIIAGSAASEEIHVARISRGAPRS